MRTSALLAVLLASLFLCACSGQSSPGSPLIELTPGTTATVVVRHPLLRAIPRQVTELRFTGRDAAGAVQFGPVTRPKAAEISLVVPVSVTLLHIEYRVDGQLTGVYSTPLQLEPGQTFVLEDPRFTLLDELLSLAVHPRQAVLTVGGSLAFSALGSFTGPTEQDVTVEVEWTTSNPAVASVDAQGRVTALAPGDAVISASLHGQIASGQLRVTPATLQTLTVSPQSATLHGHETRQLSVQGSYSDGAAADLTEQVAWSSGNPAVVSVSALGLARGQGLGTATVQASLQGLTVEASLRVEPTSGELTGIRNFLGSATETAVATGDFDRRNGPDLLSANGTGVDVLFNRGDGTFSPVPVIYAIPSPCVGIAVADFDRQNGPDFATANTNDQSVTVFLNQGDGTFSPPVRIPSGPFLVGLAAGDLDGQNGLDLVAIDEQDDRAFLYLNQGDGAFVAAGSVSTGQDATDLAVGDLDGQNGPDLVISQEGFDQVAVLLNQGGGTFGSLLTFSTGSQPQTVVLGDLDGRNGLDIAVACYQAEVTVLLNQGDAQSFARSDVSAGSNPLGLACADLDGRDGLDLAVTRDDEETSIFDTRLLFNQGDGTFGPATSLNTGEDTIAVTTDDLDGRNGPDLVLAHRGVAVALNQGQGNFATYPTVAVGVDTSEAGVAAGDLDGRLGPDVVVGSEDAVFVLLNDGRGNPGNPVSYSLGSSGGGGPVALGDFDDKTGLDVAALNRAGVEIFLNRGDGSLLPPVQLQAPGAYGSVAVGDFDARNGPDVAVLGPDNDVLVFLNQGDGTFAPPTSLATPNEPFTLATGNFDRLNGDDLAVSASGNDPNPTVRVFLSLGATFGASTDYPAPLAAFGLTAGDFDGRDGLDLAAAGLDSGDLTLLVNQGNGVFTPLSASLPPGLYDYGLATGDVNGDGRADLVVAGLCVAVMLDPLAPPTPTNVHAYAQHSWTAAVADFNGDGLADVVTPLDDSVGVLLGRP